MANIHPEMLISDVLSKCPGAIEVFERHGLGCASCLAAGMEPLSAVAAAHDVSTSALIAEIEAMQAEACDPPKGI